MQQSKSLLLNHSLEMLSLSKWERFFCIMPVMRAESKMVFMHMIYKCKYTKFCEINFKILACILVTLKILSHIHKNPSLAMCPWCSNVGTLEHCLGLFTCHKVATVQNSLVQDNISLFGQWSNCFWCFGALKGALNPIIWVVNFAIYKGFLRASGGYKEDLLALIAREYSHYEYLFPVLSELQWSKL